MAPGNEPVIEGLSGLQLVGRGGFSTVYRARQERLARDVAVKVLHVDISDPRARAQFHNECTAAGAMANHPNIVTVYDSGVTASGEPYLVMEYCDQGSLADRVRGGALDPATAVTILIKLCGALATAHQFGILHRDIKPENVLFTSYGEPALADFGVASLTSGAQKSFTVAALTPNHAAPEVLDGGRASAASDVYSLASTAYQILTGAPPFQRGRDEGLLSFFGRVVREPAPPLVRADVPAGLASAIARGLAKTPERRYATAEAFGHDLRQVRLADGVSATAPVVPTSAVVPAPTTVSAAVNAPRPALPDAPAPVPGDVVIPPPPPPGALAASQEGNVTMLRPGGRPSVPPAPVPAHPNKRNNWLVPVLAGIVVLVLLCGVGGYFGYQRLFGVPSGEQPVADGTTPIGTSGAAATTSTIVAATATQTESATASGAPPPNPGGGDPGAPPSTKAPTTQPPPGPTVEYLRVKQQPRCPAGTRTNPIPGDDVILEWKVSAPATGSTLSVDGPGTYGEYGVTGSETLAFPCGDWSPGQKATHTYTVTTVGGGQQKSRTITVTAVVNDIGNV